MPVRDWYISEALVSLRRLHRVLSDMTEEEVLAALKLESESRRRKVILERLISKAARLNELHYVTKLRSLTYGTR